MSKELAEELAPATGKGDLEAGGEREHPVGFHVLDHRGEYFDRLLDRRRGSIGVNPDPLDIGRVLLRNGFCGRSPPGSRV